MVGPERLRFDFSHPKPMTADEIAEVEAIVNGIVRQNTEVSTRLMTPEDAIEAGALALFGEKYGDEVRVLAMGPRRHQIQRHLLGRALRRYACAPAGRHRDLQDRERERGRIGYSPHRGADGGRARGAISSSRSGP